MLIEQAYSVVLFGHRDFDSHNALEQRLYPILRNLITTKKLVRIFIGRNGEFDRFAATIVKRLQKELGKENTEFICVLPYPQKDIEYYENYYDSVIIPEIVEKTHPKQAITKRNEWMIEQCDLFICYVQHQGGAKNALEYAKKLGKDIINLEKEIE